MNHDFASLKRDITDAELKEGLDKLSAETFKGVYKVDALEPGKWVVHIPTHPYCGCQVWLKTKRKVEIRRGSGNDLAGWVGTVIQNYFASKGAGRCSSQGAPETWEAEDKVLTFMDYYARRYGPHSPHLWALEEPYWPDALRPLLV